MEQEAPWYDITVRPNGDVEVTQEPDGTMELSWGGITVLLSRDRLRELVERAQYALLVTSPVA